MYGGTVKWFDKGKGFGLVGDGHGGDDAPAGFSSIYDERFQISGGQKAAFDTEADPKDSRSGL